MNFRLGLPITVAQGLLHAAASACAGFTLLRITKSQSWGLLLFVALLFLPAMYFTPARIIRDYFYTSVTLLFFSSLLLLTFDRSRIIQLVSALVAGFGAGILWITREEGIWIVPASLLALIVAAVWGEHGSRARLAALVALASSCVALTVVAVGGANAHVYGRFIVSELRDGDFQSALTWLQRASSTHWRPYVGVPREARLELYRHSPTLPRSRPSSIRWTGPRHGTKGARSTGTRAARLQTAGSCGRCAMVQRWPERMPLPTGPRGSTGQSQGVQGRMRCRSAGLREMVPVVSAGYDLEPIGGPAR